MKRQTCGRASGVLIFLLFLAGLSLLLYPSVSNYWNTARQTRAILSYDDSVSRLREEEARRLLEEAEDFNRSLLNRPSSYVLTEDQAARYPSTLLTNIDHLEPGDLFYIHVLGQRLAYQVDQISVVEPDDFSLLGIEEGKDYVTLLTCTPYGINTHQLLVRGVRVQDGGTVTGTVNPPNELQAISAGYLFSGALLLCAILILIFLLLQGRKTPPGRRETHG